MTDANHPDSTAPSHADQAIAARERLCEISDLYERLRQSVSRAIAEQCPINLQTTKQLSARVDDLIKAHLLLVMAEERFNERYKEDGSEPGLDYDKIRDDIGSALDRIRATSNPDSLPEGPDR